MTVLDMLPVMAVLRRLTDMVEKLEAKVDRVQEQLEEIHTLAIDEFANFEDDSDTEDSSEEEDSAQESDTASVSMAQLLHEDLRCLVRVDNDVEKLVTCCYL